MLRLRFVKTDYELTEIDGELYAEADTQGACVRQETYTSVTDFIHSIADYAAYGEPSSFPGKLTGGDWLEIRDEDYRTGGWVEKVCALHWDATPFEIMLFNAAIAMYSTAGIATLAGQEISPLRLSKTRLNTPNRLVIPFHD